MAGRPKRNADLAVLSNILPATAAVIYESIANGQSLARISEARGIGKWALTTWLEHPERIDLYNRARKRAATTLAEQTLEIADAGIDVDGMWNGNGMAADESATAGAQNIPDAARDKLRIQSRQWLAGKWDREQYGEQRGPAVTINLATLHIDALRRTTREAQPSQVLIPQQVTVETE